MELYIVFILHDHTSIETYTLSLHDALPISLASCSVLCWQPVWQVSLPRISTFRNARSLLLLSVASCSAMVHAWLMAVILVRISVASLQAVYMAGYGWCLPLSVMVLGSNFVQFSSRKKNHKLKKLQVVNYLN